MNEHCCPICLIKSKPAVVRSRGLDFSIVIAIIIMRAAGQAGALG
jgi:hypothetical protein